MLLMYTRNRTSSHIGSDSVMSLLKSFCSDR